MKYPIGIQTFANIRQEGYLYVDKTALVYQLAIAGKYYFLSRPRRFGKSLLITTLEALFANQNYQIAGDAELYFHNAVNVIFQMLGFYVETERHTSDGSMDMVVQTKDHIYIFEFKLDQSVAKALEQIEEKQYAAPFAQDMRKLYKIGVNFSSTTRKVEAWQVVER